MPLEYFLKKEQENVAEFKAKQQGNNLQAG